ncbi:MAG: sigma factor [Patescibacteria group bacterium]
MKDSENKAIDNCKKGNFKEFALLYDLYVKKIYRFIFYKTHHKQTTEDLVSDTFTKALNKIDSFNRERLFFIFFVFKIN